MGLWMGSGVPGEKPVWQQLEPQVAYFLYIADGKAYAMQTALRPRDQLAGVLFYDAQHSEGTLDMVLRHGYQGNGFTLSKTIPTTSLYKVVTTRWAKTECKEQVVMTSTHARFGLETRLALVHTDLPDKRVELRLSAHAPVIVLLPQLAPGAAVGVPAKL